MFFIKTFFTTILIIVGFATVQAQITQINLEQVQGDFTTESVDLSEGDYQFNISNNNVGKDVGFVLVPAGKYDQTDHIKAAYVTEVAGNNKTSQTGVVNLTPGTYEYFCPMNPTPKHTLTVHPNVQTIRLNQVEGKFIEDDIKVRAGQVQFEVANVDIDREVGFVLVPQGQYDQSNHIKSAYVTSPVAKDKSSRTGIVDLEPGVYEYFCPLNPTPKYTLTVVE